MSKIFVSFEAEGPDELMQLILSFALKGRSPPSWVGAPLDAEALQAEAEAREQIEAEDDAEDAKRAEFPDGNGADPEPTPASASAKRARAPRTPRVPAVPPAAPVSVSPPLPAPPPPPPPPDLPPLDALKAVVTAAVRLAQKGEGSRKIIDLLPGFKDATGLDFVMNAEDKHRGALYDLVQAAGLPVV